MEKGIVVEGDPLSSGGKVTKGSGTIVNGLRIAVLGDPVDCPIPLHGSGTITEGEPKALIGDKPIALEGHKVSCGCTLIAKTVGEKFKIGVSQPPEPSFIEKVDDLINKLNDKIDRAVINTLDKILPKPIQDLNDLVKPYICALPEIPVVSKKTEIPSAKKVLTEALLEQAKELYCFDRSHYKNNSENKPTVKEQNKLEYIPLNGSSKDLKCEGNKYIGGRHADTTQPKGDGLDSHHMPAKSAYEGSKMNPDGEAKQGPAIKMEPKDHRDTKSYGKKGEQYRQKQKELIQQGKLKEAVQMDIEDIRRIALEDGKPDKYECGIKEYIENYNKYDPNDFIIK
ncbi:PAAR domain-containing protein [Silvanigrella aquatica]|uniref:PAAR domain-containing protein n=1 Tax=Silvanigrella aquatica TaxID=1915309 RepID=A0A1L4CY10_9BACT|nr:PAAR domain-containing protein [Silvanigrella aquatica]APJ02827.1 hypothetical protein AXG55_02380 [Silvanigrella aquatica]